MTPRDHAEAALLSLGCEEALTRLRPLRRARSEAERWEDSGLLALTGFQGRPPVQSSVPLPSFADGALDALAALAPEGAFAGLAGGAELLAERANLTGLSRNGRVSPGGSCHLLRTQDGWVAVNLPRSDDVASLAAWLEDDSLGGVAPLDRGVWEQLANRLADRRSDDVVTRARWLGLAVAHAGRPSPLRAPWLRVETGGRRNDRPRAAPPVVVDLSSLWAGPLAGRLLRLAGARVIKVESARRPDGARIGSGAFFELLNGGKESAVLDFGTAGGQRALADLVAGADIVIDSSRPRALRQLGIDAAEWVAERPGRIWLSITGYGRREEEAVAFGDDAAASAGLCWCVPVAAPLFVGDAIADPLTGLHAALATSAYWQRGEGALLDVSLAGTVAQAIASGAAADLAGVERVLVSA